MTASRRLLERIGLHRPELRAWAMYDWANSAVFTLIITAVYPIYFAQVAAADLPQTAATTRHAYTTTAAVIVAGLMSPILGAIADHAAIKKRLLGTFLGVGVAAVCGLFFVQRGDWLLGMALFFVINVCVTASFVFYDALLPHVARDDELDRLSTAGYALGYVGGGLLLAAALVVILNPELIGVPPGGAATPQQATLPSRLTFVAVGVWWLLFAIPLFRRVPEPAVAVRPGARGVHAVAAAVMRLRKTVSELRRYRNAFLMLVAYLIYGDGITTIIRMATVYGSEIGIERNAMILAVVITQFVGIPCAFLFGMLAAWIGAKRAIFLGLLVYGGICTLGYFMTSAAHFLILAGLVGTVQGGTQALSRSLYASMIPAHRSGEFFGLYGVIDRFGGLAGTAMLATVGSLMGTSRHGVLAIIALFAIGAAVLYVVDEDEGRRIARQLERAAP